MEINEEETEEDSRRKRPRGLMADGAGRRPADQTSQQ